METRYRCKFCSDQFKDLDAVNEHCRSKHGYAAPPTLDRWKSLGEKRGVVFPTSDATNNRSAALSPADKTGDTGSRVSDKGNSDGSGDSVVDEDWEQV